MSSPTGADIMSLGANARVLPRMLLAAGFIALALTPAVILLRGAYATLGRQSLAASFAAVGIFLFVKGLAAGHQQGAFDREAGAAFVIFAAALAVLWGAPLFAYRGVYRWLAPGLLVNLWMIGWIVAAEHQARLAFREWRDAIELESRHPLDRDSATRPARLEQALERARQDWNAVEGHPPLARFVWFGDPVRLPGHVVAWGLHDEGTASDWAALPALVYPALRAVGYPSRVSLGVAPAAAVAALEGGAQQYFGADGRARDPQWPVYGDSPLG